jgi:hypothetical protein
MVKEGEFPERRPKHETAIATSGTFESENNLRYQLNELAKDKKLEVGDRMLVAVVFNPKTGVRRWHFDSIIPAAEWTGRGFDKAKTRKDFFSRSRTTVKGTDAVVTGLVVTKKEKGRGIEIDKSGFGAFQRR